MDLKAALKGKLSGSELGLLHKSYDIIGDIAIIEIPSELEAKKKIIAEALLQMNKNIKVVLRKTEKVAGEWRTAKYETMMGDHTETIHTEAGCKFKVDPTRVYFSPRLAGERLRIAENVKDGENILVMFAGVCPYAIVIARRKDVQVWAVENNPLACKYAEENVVRNNVFGKVGILCGDVKDIVPRIDKKFDRIVMPAPTTAFGFLPIVLPKIKKGGTIHFYAFVRSERPPKKITGEKGRAAWEATPSREALSKRLATECKKLGYNINVVKVVTTGETAPRTERVCIDFMLD